MADPWLANGRPLGKPAERKVGQLGEGRIAGEHGLQSDDHGIGLGDHAVGMKLPSPVIVVVGDVKDGLAGAEHLAGGEHRHVGRIGKGPVNGHRKKRVAA